MKEEPSAETNALIMSRRPVIVPWRDHSASTLGTRHSRSNEMASLSKSLLLHLFCPSQTM